MNIPLLVIAIATLIINIPFGYWREGVKRFSINWFFTVHAAVPIVILLRIMAHIEWHVTTIGFLVFCYFLGQTAGSGIRKIFRPVTEIHDGDTQ